MEADNIREGIAIPSRGCRALIIPYRSLLFIGILYFLLILCSCFSRSSLMTYEEFDHVELGTSIATVQSEIGEPYAIHNKKGGAQEYEYIERIDTGTNVVAENHYFLIVQDGKVTGKYVKRERPPAYDLIYQDQPNYYPEYPGSALPP